MGWHRTRGVRSRGNGCRGALSSDIPGRQSGGDERRIFKAWTSNEEIGVGQPIAGHEYTFNSTELRLISSSSATAGNAIALEMSPLPPIGGVPLNVVRSSGRLAAQPRPN